MFDAAPYTLNGRPREEPDYVQQRYGASLGGPLSIPGLFNGGTRTSFFFNYAGNHSKTPVDAYSTVPTPAERAGDFSASSSIVIDPDTGEPFPGNRVPASRVDPAARSLLAYIPLPNVLDTTQNFHYVTANSSKSNDVNLRVTHVFGTQPQRGAGGGRGRGGFAPGGQGRGGPGGPGGPFGGRAGRGGPLPTRSVLNASLGFRQSSNQSSSTFPTIGGSAETKGLEPAGQLDADQGALHQHAQRHLQPQQLPQRQPLRLHDGRRRHRWHRRRLDRSVRLGHSRPVVHVDRRPARPHAVEPRRSALPDQQHDGAAVRPPLAALRRRVPLPAARQPVEQQSARQLRLHRPLHVSPDEQRRRARHRARPRRLPPRPRAAGVGAVRSRGHQDARP